MSSFGWIPKVLTHEQSAGFHIKWKKSNQLKLSIFACFVLIVSFSLCIIYIFVLFMLFLNLTFDTAWSNVTAKEEKIKIKKIPKHFCFLELFTEQSNSQLSTQLSVVSIWLLYLFNLYWSWLLTNCILGLYIFLHIFYIFFN